MSSPVYSPQVLAQLQAAKQGLQLVHVAAMDSQRCIGVDNTLPWHIADDLQHFKTITQGGVIAMGRKTFDSLPRLLPKRTHVVLTTNVQWQHDSVLTAHSLLDLVTTAADAAKNQGADRFFIIGGGQLYAATLAIADILHLTHVQLDVGGDTHYPSIDPNQWHITPSATQVDQTSGAAFNFADYQRRS